MHVCWGDDNTMKSQCLSFKVAPEQQIPGSLSKILCFFYSQLVKTGSWPWRVHVTVELLPSAALKIKTTMPSQQQPSSHKDTIKRHLPPQSRCWKVKLQNIMTTIKIRPYSSVTGDFRYILIQKCLYMLVSFFIHKANILVAMVTHSGSRLEQATLTA